MPQASRTLTIAAPVEKVFAFFTDPANEKSWRDSVREIAADGPPAVGGVVRMTVNAPIGPGIKADIEITEYDAPNRYAFRGISGPVQPQGSYTLAPAGDGTEVTFVLSVELNGLKGKLLAPHVQKSMDAEMAGLDRAKALLEA